MACEHKGFAVTSVEPETSNNYDRHVKKVSFIDDIVPSQANKAN